MPCLPKFRQLLIESGGETLNLLLILVQKQGQDTMIQECPFLNVEQRSFR